MITSLYTEVSPNESVLGQTERSASLSDEIANVYQTLIRQVVTKVDVPFRSFLSDHDRSNRMCFFFSAEFVIE